MAEIPLVYRYWGIPRTNYVPFYIEVCDSQTGAISQLDLGNSTVISGVVLMINPSTMNSNMSKIINRTQTMTSWVEEHWGEELDTVSFQGSTASFIWGGRMLPDVTKTKQVTSSGTEIEEATLEDDIDTIRTKFNVSSDIMNIQIGLNTEYRRQSVSYREFKKIIEIVNTNACNFDDFGFVKERKSVQITYDYSQYRGYFESFDVTEDANSPYKFTYVATFKAEKTIFKFNSRNI
jgi:hypothetical protein